MNEKLKFSLEGMFRSSMEMYTDKRVLAEFGSGKIMSLKIAITFVVYDYLLKKHPSISRFSG